MNLEQLNEQQQKVVRHTSGPLAVLAAAGSGKTRSMVTKLQYLVEHEEINPLRIWAITYTNKAANEMKERLTPLLGSDAAKIKLSTIHSMAYKIFKQGMQLENPHTKMPKILTQAMSYGVITHLFKFCKAQDLSSKNARAYLELIGKAKLALVTPQNFGQFYPLYEPGKSEAPNLFNRDCAIVFKEYQRWLRASNFMDFNDILVNCYNLLKNPKNEAYVSRLQEKCEYMIVDEYQDTSKLPLAIIDLMSKKNRNITVVGDLKQSIYSFAGADIQSAMGFITNIKADIIDLDINYRSTKTIVNNANKFITHSTEVIGKPSNTPNDVGDEITQLSSLTSCEESLKVLDLVRELTTQGYDYKDIAILYRVHSQSREIEDQFIINEIPYITFNDTDFFIRKEIKDILTYLRIIIDTNNASIKDLKRIANRPVRYLSNKAMDNLGEFAFDNGLDYLEALEQIHDSDLPYNEKAALDRLCDHLYQLRSESNKGKTTQEITEFILKNMGYEEWFKKETQEKRPDVDIEMTFDALLDSVSRFEKPEEYLQFVDKVQKENKKKKDENGDFVKMMSIHASKGKEFKIVILAGFCDRIYPFHKSVQEGNIEEEKRVMYVAITRAEKKLYLSHIAERMGRFKVNSSPFSSYMAPIYKGELDGKENN